MTMMILVVLLLELHFAKEHANVVVGGGDGVLVVMVEEVVRTN